MRQNDLLNIGKYYENIVGYKKHKIKEKDKSRTYSGS